MEKPLPYIWQAYDITSPQFLFLLSQLLSIITALDHSSRQTVQHHSFVFNRKDNGSCFSSCICSWINLCNGSPPDSLSRCHQKALALSQCNQSIAEQNSLSRTLQSASIAPGKACASTNYLALIRSIHRRKQHGYVCIHLDEHNDWYIAAKTDFRFCFFSLPESIDGRILRKRHILTEHCQTGSWGDATSF